MLIYWAEKFDKFLMKNVIETKARLLEMFNLRYQKINKIYNSDHHMTWIREDEAKYAYV